MSGTFQWRQIIAFKKINLNIIFNLKLSEATINKIIIMILVKVKTLKV